MDLTTVYSKTAKGVQAITQKGKRLPSKLLRALSLVDGRATVEEILEKAHESPTSALPQALADLARDGYLKTVARAPLTQFSVTPDTSASMVVSETVDETFFKVLAETETRKRRMKEAAENLQEVRQKDRAEAAAAAEKEAARRKAETREAAEDEERSRQEAVRRKIAQVMAQEEAAIKARRQADILAHQEKVEKLEREMAEAEERARREAQEKAAKEAASRAAAELRAKEDEKERTRQEAEQRKIAEAKAQEETERKAREEAEAGKKREAAEKARAEEEARARGEAERKAREEAEQNALQEMERQKAAAAQAFEEAQRKAQEEADNQARREKAEKEQAATEERMRREAEAKAATEAAERKAQEEAAAIARAEASKQLEMEARAREEAERNQARERKIAEAEAKAKAEAEELARAEARRQLRLEARAREEAERNQAREEAEAKAKAEAEERKRLEAEAEHRARLEAEEKARAEEEARIQAEADARAREEAERKAREEAEARAIAEAEKQARREAEEKIRAQEEALAKARAQEERKAREEAEQEKRERAEIEARARALADARAAEAEKDRQKAQAKAKKPRHPVKWGKTALISLAALILLPIALLQVMSLNLFIPSIEKLASDRMREPVSIHSLRASLWPAPHLLLEGVAIGKLRDIKMPAVRITPELSAFFGSTKTIKAIEVESLTIDQDALTRAIAWVAPGGGAEETQIRRIFLKTATIDIKGMPLPPFEADIALTTTSKFERAHIMSADKKIELSIAPNNDGVEVDVAAHDWQPPLGPNLTFSELHAKAMATPEGMRISEIGGRLFGGKANGSATIQWGGLWRAEGDFVIENVLLAEAMPALTGDIALTGKLDAKAIFSMQSKDLPSLFGNPRVKARFDIRDGAINNIDLARAIQPRAAETTGGKTLFAGLSGSMMLEGSRYQYRQMKLAAGLLSASGEADIMPDKQLTGKANVEMKLPSTTVRARLTLFGDPKQPVLRR